MPANAKDNVDWNVIKAEWLNGRGIRAIGRDHKVSHQAIAKRRDREGWQKRAKPGEKWTPDVSKLRVADKPKTFKDKMIAAHGVGLRTSRKTFLS